VRAGYFDRERRGLVGREGSIVYGRHRRSAPRGLGVPVDFFDG